MMIYSRNEAETGADAGVGVGAVAVGIAMPAGIAM